MLYWSLHRTGKGKIRVEQGDADPYGCLLNRKNSLLATL